MRRVICFVALALATTVVVAAPAAACGGLVGENGTIQLTRTTTLAAYHDGVERYVTSFEFSGTGQSVGSIVPLPGVPTKVERGGDWTLQRLEREIAPPAPERFAAAADALSAAGAAEVLQQTQVDALDITILRGGGDAGRQVGDRPRVPAHARRARGARLLLAPLEDLHGRALRRRPRRVARPAVGRRHADHAHHPHDEPWVPLRILALGLDSSQFVNADVFLLTDQRPNVLAADTGVEVGRSEPASASLLDDLRSDKHMGWVPESMWFTYYDVSTPAARAAPRPRGVDARRHAAVGADGRLLGAGDRPTPSDDWWIPVPPRRGAAGAGRGRYRPGAAASVVNRVVLRPPAGRWRRSRRCWWRWARVPSCWPVRVRAVRRPPTACSGPAGDGAHRHRPQPLPHRTPIRVRPHTEVRFVIVNHDPIGHELIVGGPDVQARHANGHEAYHPPVPGEVSVPAEGRASTTYFFQHPDRSSTPAISPVTTSTACTASSKWWRASRFAETARARVSDSAPMELRPFGTLTIVTDPDGLFFLGTTSAGKRIIQELKSVQLDGRVQGTMTGKAAADWLTVDDAGNVTLDIRVLLTTDDGAQVYVHLDGRAQWPERLGDGPIYSRATPGGGRRALRVGEPPAAGVEGRGRRRWRRRPRALRTRLARAFRRR